MGEPCPKNIKFNHVAENTMCVRPIIQQNCVQHFMSACGRLARRHAMSSLAVLAFTIKGIGALQAQAVVDDETSHGKGHACPWP